MLFNLRVRLAIWRLGAEHRQFTDEFLAAAARRENLRTPQEVAEWAVKQLPLGRPESFFGV